MMSRVVAIFVIISWIGLYALVQLPSVSTEEKHALIERFNFRQYAVPVDNRIPAGDRLPVNPALKHIEPWISTVGASIAALDLDLDGLENDLCITDPRTRSLYVAPAMAADQRFAPATLLVVNRDFSEASFPSGCRVGDFNEDGLADILAIFFGRSPIILMQKSDTDLPLEQRFVKQELVTGDVQDWYTSTATLADLDNDGHIDVILGNYFPDGNSVYNANSTHYPSFHNSLSNADNAGSNRIFLWKKSNSGLEPYVEFKEADSGMPEGDDERWTLAIGAADINRDGASDLYIANDFGPDGMYLNESTPGSLSFRRLTGKKGFSIPKSKVLGHDSFKGMGVDFGDVNRDGYYDIFVSNIAGEWKLEEGHFLWMNTGDRAAIEEGIAPFVEKSSSLGVAYSGWGWDTKFADFDNDGVLEALQATGFFRGEVNKWPELHQWSMNLDPLLSDPKTWPNMIGGDISGDEGNPFYVMSSEGHFEDISEELGVAGPWLSRGFAIADIDGDGDLDYAVGNQWEDHYLLLNETNNGNGFLSLSLLLPLDSNSGFTSSPRRPLAREGTPAIGAEVTVTGPKGEKFIGFVDGGNGHAGARSKSVHFGLGAVSENEEVSVQIRWRNRLGKLNNWEGKLPVGQHTILLGNQDQYAANTDF
ncbi:CRTAC1 family protein [Microbulbifer discodermiae]|uniref:CRTAC1 family protein n=1 Tax=Microbulbifer sp. 2201CG32-9 TaxID=3232309 RepID=UPI00345B9662